jgi:hypothetical protein
MEWMSRVTTGSDDPRSEQQTSETVAELSRRKQMDLLSNFKLA